MGGLPRRNTAGDAVNRAWGALRRARAQLAAESTPAYGVTYNREGSKLARRLSQARADNLKGVAVGQRERAGVCEDELVATFFVDQKRDVDQLGDNGIPPSIDGCPTDVVALGEFEELAVLGLGLGNHDGSKGTLGVMARHQDEGEVAITAMHVSNSQDLYYPSPADSGEHQLFARFLHGSRDGTDVAALAPLFEVVNQLPRIGQIRGWRPLCVPGDVGCQVRVYGATSGYLQGHVLFPDADLPSIGLRQTFLAAIDVQPGDSGCACVDDEGYLLGFLVGRFRRPDDIAFAVFTQADLAFDKLGCNL